MNQPATVSLSAATVPTMAAAMIPMSITLNSDRVPSRTFNFTVVKDVTFTPLLTYLSIANVLTTIVILVAFAIAVVAIPLEVLGG